MQRDSISLPQRPAHVLLVDDDEYMRELLDGMLRSLGVQHITTAADGKQGFAAFQAAAQAPDLVICDINMPDTDGFQMMELLANGHGGCGVILVSGLADRFRNSAMLMARFHHLNVLGTLPKPIEKRALAELVAKHLTTLERQ
jgi:CheY-like chemotaxis protein